ncbi:MAG TPA: hypothetical protein VIL69_24775 [Roseomonas sp.]
MRQDTDVARMAAALRTPSLKYRSFGNEPVRKAPVPKAAAEEQAFNILGEALAGVGDLSPDTILNDLGPPPPAEIPVLPARKADVPSPDHMPLQPALMSFDASARSHPAALDPNLEDRRTAAPLPLPQAAAAPQPLPVAPARPRPAAAVPLAPEPPGQDLLQVLLGGHIPPSSPALPAAPQPATPVRPAAPPVVPQALAMPILSGLGSESSAWPGMRTGGSTGSSLLDALMGFGPVSGTASIHYPLLDALGDAMRGTAAEPSPRHWPAARVDIALPELLRRVAAGIRFARSAA